MSSFAINISIYDIPRIKIHIDQKYKKFGQVKMTLYLASYIFLHYKIEKKILI